MEIVVTDLYKSFNGNAVLRGATLAIQPGSVTVIVGGSGIGKSVFLKHLIGLLKPDSGSIKIDGREITTLRERDLLPIRARFGMIFQGGALLASLSVGENVALGLVENRRATRAEAARQAREMLKLVGLELAFDTLPEQLSGGMRKRAAIARALTMKPDCLLYDEPTTGLDPPRSRQIEELLLEVNQSRGATSIVVTHDMDCIRRVADFVHMLHEGKIIFSGAADDFWKSQDPVVREFIER
jgi:phospholipid/cholesterol/gamma-HCH transport system ATP-binding protein